MKTNAIQVQPAGPQPAHPTALPQQEVFALKVDIRRFMRRMYPLLALIWVMFAVLVLVILAFLGMNATLAVIGAGMVATAVCAGLYQTKIRQLERLWSGVTLTLSASGMVVDEQYRVVRLPWEQVRGVGRGDIVSPYKLRLNKVGRGGRAGATAALSRPEAALIGAGTVTLKPKLPLMIWMSLRLDAALRRKEAATGQPRCAILVGHYETNWQEGRIGRWIGAYRPDVLAAAVEATDIGERHPAH